MGHRRHQRSGDLRNRRHHGNRDLRRTGATTFATVDAAGAAVWATVDTSGAATFATGATTGTTTFATVDTAGAAVWATVDTSGAAAVTAVETTGAAASTTTAGALATVETAAAGTVATFDSTGPARQAPQPERQQLRPWIPEPGRQGGSYHGGRRRPWIPPGAAACTTTAGACATVDTTGEVAGTDVGPPRLAAALTASSTPEGDAEEVSKDSGDEESEESAHAIDHQEPRSQAPTAIPKTASQRRTSRPVGRCPDPAGGRRAIAITSRLTPWNNSLDELVDLQQVPAVRRDYTSDRDLPTGSGRPRTYRRLADAERLVHLVVVDLSSSPEPCGSSGWRSITATQRPNAQATISGNSAAQNGPPWSPTRSVILTSAPAFRRASAHRAAFARKNGSRVPATR